MTAATLNAIKKPMAITTPYKGAMPVRSNQVVAIRSAMGMGPLTSANAANTNWVCEKQPTTTATTTAAKNARTTLPIDITTGHPPVFAGFPSAFSAQRPGHCVCSVSHVRYTG